MARGSKRFVGQYIVIDARSGQGGPCRLGITVTRRYGEAHERNRFKRLVREAFRLSYLVLPSGLQINVKPRSDSLKISMHDLQDELNQLLIPFFQKNL